MKMEPQSATTEPMTIVIGNIPEVTSTEQAKEWLVKRCMDAGIPQPIEVFVKSESFQGILFAKATSASHREGIIASVRNFRSDVSPKPWAKIDQPIDVRTAESVLFAFKTLLVQWKYGKKEVYVDRAKCVLSVAGTEVLKAKVENYELKLTWCNGEWECWEDLQTAQELVALKSKAQETLDRAKHFGSTVPALPKDAKDAK